MANNQGKENKDQEVDNAIIEEEVIIEIKEETEDKNKDQDQETKREAEAILMIAANADIEETDLDQKNILLNITAEDNTGEIDMEDQVPLDLDLVQIHMKIVDVITIVEKVVKFKFITEYY